MSEAYDLVVVGGGPAGYVGAIRASQLGLRTALVEREKLGGVCLNWGCVPTKVLLHAADLLRQLKSASSLGIECGPASVDFAKLQKRKGAVVEGLGKGVQLLMRKHKVDVHSGTGRLLGKGRVAVEGPGGPGLELSARHILIATGSAPRGVPGVEIDNERIIDSTGALSLGEVPKSIAILGGGAIGVEFATLFAALGSRVTLVELLPTLLPLEDAEVGRALEKIYKRRGIAVHTGTTVKAAVHGKAGLQISLEKGGETESITADYLLVAVGRAPQTEGLGLAEAGVEVKPQGVVVDAGFRTAVPEILAVGDVIGGPFRLAHVASDEAIHAVESIAGEAGPPIDYMTVPRPTFSTPQVATMGQSETQAEEAGRAVKVGRFAFAANSKATIDGEREGFVKIVSDAATGEVLGVHILGPSATELLAAGVATRFLEGTVAELGGAVYAHPTLSEALKEAALDAMGRVLHA